MRYHVYALKNQKSESTPYVLDLQSDLLSGMKTRIVAPLRLRSAINRAEIMRDLMPVFEIAGLPCVLFPQEMAAYPVNLLGAEVANLSPHSASIMNALDRLLS